MSFDNSPSSFAHLQSSVASSSDKEEHSGSNPRTSNANTPWPHSTGTASNKRGLTPLATSNLGSFAGAEARRQSLISDNQSPASATSPSVASYPSLPTSSNRFAARRATPPTSGPSAFPWSSVQAGGIQPPNFPSHRSITSPRSRTITPSQLLASGIAIFPQSGQGAAGGGGGGLGSSSRSGAYSPSYSGSGLVSPVAHTFERSPSISSNPGSVAGSQSSLSKISAAQVSLLVDTISEKKGPVEWEAKAEKIRKLLNSNGMEVFTQFFRRVVTSNAPTIFHGARDSDHGNYKLLLQEMDKVSHDPDQAAKIAEAIEASKEDIFRDFDLAGFLSHFYSDPVPKVLLGIAFTRCQRPDLRNKAEKILSDLSTPCFQKLADPNLDLQRYHSRNLSAVVEYLAFSPSLSAQEQRYQLLWAIGGRYDSLNMEIPDDIMSALVLLKMSSDHQKLARGLLKAGAKRTTSKEDVLDILYGIGLNNVDDLEIAQAILLMVLSPSQSFDISTFIAAIQSKSNHINVDWPTVLASFNMQGVRVQPDSFLRLFKALRQVAVEDPTCDLQKLWSGQWQDPLAQLSFVRAFLLAPTEDAGPSQVPNFRPGVSPEELDTLPDESKKELESKVDTPFNSLDALHAVFELLLSPEIQSDEREKNDLLNEIYQTHSEVFLLALPKLKPKPWTAMQEKFVYECFRQYLEMQRPNYAPVLKALYAKSSQFVFDLCAISFQQDPRKTEIIYERAEEFDWTTDFLKHWSNPLALDMACMRNKLQQDFDLDKYFTDIAEGKGQAQLGMILCKYLRIKADDEYRVQREKMPAQSVPLSLGSVYTLLERVEEFTDDRELVESAQTTCLTTYPRLMNYGTGFDDILERSSEERGNKLRDEIDARMSNLFGKMYRSELSIRDMVSEMGKYKTSRDPDEQDLFCCIVHGLFDEYVCYNEYPEEALEKTALLFGNIIKYKLLPSIPRDYGLALILRSVRDHSPDSLMYRFGVEALLQVSDQLPEWPGLCSLLLRIPSLKNTEIFSRAQEGLEKQQADALLNGDGGHSFTNGDGHDFLRQDGSRGFRSIHAYPPAAKHRFKDPQPNAQEKILFVINNLSKENMVTKLEDLKSSISPEHYQWLASYLVEQRAKLEPNNQEMYFQFISKLEDSLLLSEVLRETYISIVKLMNADATIHSSNERNRLKNLGSWLGSLTLAQNKPVLHKNIYFVELLLEGYETQRLLLIIPFTCRVLSKGVDSLIFKPPNPWVMEILGVLKELYEFADLKLNQKFEIEVLCKDLKQDIKKLEPATVLREKTQADDAITSISALPDGLESFDELSLNGAMGRGVRERLSATEIMSTLPSLSEVLKFPPPTQNPADQAMIQDIIYRAFDQAIQEIIAPVVERSITIASISTAQLISKDYALNADPEQYQDAAREMVKSLAGSLALVTCKEPLRMAITNWIRRPQDDMHEPIIPEGSILMCVNDNLDTACSFVERAAIERAIPEIDIVIASELEERRRFLEQGGDSRNFTSTNANTNRWSTWIPEPYKLNSGPLNEAQRAVYEEFGPRTRGANIGHATNVSTDSTGRQIPDVLRDALAIPSLSTPADSHAMPHQSPMVQTDARALGTISQPRLNGLSDNVPPQERIAILIEDVQKAARMSEASRLKDLEKNSSIFQDFRQILIVLTSATRPTADLLARQIAEKICNIFATKPPQDALEAEVLAFLLSKLCQLSELIIRDVLRWMTSNEHILLGSSNVVAALVIVGLLDFNRVDSSVAVTLNNREQQGLQLLSDLMDQTLFLDEPQALRADFAQSLVAMAGWLKESPDLQPAAEINEKLKARGMPEFVNAAVSDKAKAKQDQMRYIFDEWVALYENIYPDATASGGFLRDLHKDQVLNSTEDIADFLRLSIDICVEAYEREAQSIRGSVDSAFLPVDALARLIVMLVVFQGDSDGAVQFKKTPYFETLLSVLVLIVNHHQVMQGVAFHQRVFHRLFSSILYEYALSKLDTTLESDDLINALGTTLRSLQPAWFPGFTFAWTSLITHRVLVGGLLNSTNEDGVAIYRDLIGLSLLYLSESIRSGMPQGLVGEMFRGVVRNMLVLHHDFPEFVCANYWYLCSRVCNELPQIRNLLLTSRPAAYLDLPDPMNPGLKVERLEEMKKNPELAGDFDAMLRREGLTEIVDSALKKNTDVDACIKQVNNILTSDQGSRQPSVAPLKSVELLNSLLPYVGQHASAAGVRFESTSIYATFLTKLALSLSYENRYYFVNALLDQNRYPNTHTDFFCKYVLHLWGTGNVPEQQRELREPICRVVYERMNVARPHPWGLAVVSMELQNNAAYGFYDVIAQGDASVHGRLQGAMRGPHSAH